MVLWRDPLDKPCKAVGSDNFKLLYDIHHMQIMEGDLIRTIKNSAPHIANISRIAVFKSPSDRKLYGDFANRRILEKHPVSPSMG